MRKTILLLVLFLFYGSFTRAQCYPSSPDEIGLIGAGVDYSDLTVYPQSGTIYLNAGVYEYYDFKNCNIYIDGEVTIRKCRILWDGKGFFAVRPNGYQYVIEDSEIDGQGHADSEAIAGGGYSLIRSWVHNIGNDGMKANGNVTIDRCWIGPLATSPGGHNDIVQVLSNNSGPIIFTNSVFDGHKTSGENINTNCLRLSGEFSPVGDVIISGNYISGAGYQVTLDVRSECTYKIVNNVFEADYTFGHFYPTGAPANVLWDNNNTSSGNPIAIPGTSEYSALYGIVPNTPYSECDSGVTVAVSGVSLVPLSITLDIGNNTELTETVLPANASNKLVIWASSDIAIASVDDKGIVTGLAEGDCVITATTVSGGLTANCMVSVSAVPEPLAGKYYCDPVNGNMSNNGSEGSPWGSLEDVINSGKTFEADDIIYLMDGEHGNLVISGSNAGNVTITKYTGAAPKISRIEFKNANHWILKDVEVTSNGAAFPNTNVPLEHPVYPLAENALIQIDGSNNINIEDCYIYSVDDNAVWTTANDWNYKAWNGIFIGGGGANITINGCHIKNVNFGTNGNAANFVYKNNIIENFCGDAMQCGANYAVIENNTFMNCYDTNGNHDDLFQFFNGYGNSFGLKFRNNKLINYTDPNQLFRGYAQGIAIFNGVHSGFIIENNLVVTDHWHGLTILGAINCELINNSIIEINNTGIGPCWIQIAKSENGVLSTGNIVRNNLCTAMSNDANIGTVENNRIIPWSGYSSYFVDFENYDFHLAPNSPAIDAGSSTGAPSLDMDGVSRPQGTNHDVGCYEYTGTIIGVTGVSLSPENLNIEISETADLSLSIIPSNATIHNVTWASSNPSVAVVDNGSVIALSQGKTIVTVTTQDSGFTAKCNVTVSERSGEYNLALYKPVTVSGDDGNIGANIVDENIGTRWSADGYPQTAVIDLGKQCNISGFELNTYKGRAYQYVIEASTDGAIYSQVVDRSSNKNSIQPISDEVSVLGRYVKITVTGASGYSGTWISLNEFKVIGTTAPSGVTNLALNKPVTVDSEYDKSYPAENAVDGNNSDNTSSWLSAESDDDHWFEIDLGQTATVNQVNLWTGFNSENSFPVANYQIQYWTGSIWVDAVNVTNNTQEVISHPIPNIETEKIRLYTTSSERYIVRLYEIEVLGLPAQNALEATLAPIADSYVRGGSYESTNYGTESTLYVKNHSSSDFIRKTYLKFDLSSVSIVNNAYLRLFVNSSDGSSLHTVSVVNDDYWSENEITYNSGPTTGNKFKQWNITSSGQYIEVDITSLVSAEAGGVISLQISSNDEQYIGYDSREGANPPELAINNPNNGGLVTKNEDDLSPSELKLELWPNPAALDKKMIISLKNCQSFNNLTIKIFDISGKEVYSKSSVDASGKITINPCINTGIYILTISNKYLHLNKKFVIE